MLETPLLERLSGRWRVLPAESVSSFRLHPSSFIFEQPILLKFPERLRIFGFRYSYIALWQYVACRYEFTSLGKLLADFEHDVTFWR